MHEKNIFLGGEGGDQLKKRAWIVCRFKRRFGKKEKKKGCVFEVGEGEVETPMHTMSWRSLFIDTNI